MLQMPDTNKVKLHSTGYRRNITVLTELYYEQ